MPPSSSWFSAVGGVWARDFVVSLGYGIVKVGRIKKGRVEECT